MRSLSLASLVGLLALVAGCGGSNPEPAAPQAEATPPATAETAPAAASNAPMKAPGEATVGDRSTCPVSGEEFVVEATSPKTEYKGKTYYFCCSGCDKKFKADPEKFLSKMAH